MQKWKLMMAAALFAVAGTSANSAEILILAGQGNISGARDLGAGFAQATGHKVTARQERNSIETVNAGTPADIVLANPPVIDYLAKGDFELGLQQTNIMVGIAGTDYVGIPPGPMDKQCPSSVALMKISKEPEAARAMIRFMVSPEAAPLLRKTHVEPAK